MKVVWEHIKAKPVVIYGLYRKTGLFGRQAICYFISRSEAICTRNYLRMTIPGAKWGLHQVDASPGSM
jgi:hypothetical protein